VTIETLVSPVKIHVRQRNRGGLRRAWRWRRSFTVRIYAREGRLVGIRASGTVWRVGCERPAQARPGAGTEFTLPLDTLIVAIGERPQSDCLAAMVWSGQDWRVKIDPKTLATNVRRVCRGDS